MTDPNRSVVSVAAPREPEGRGRISPTSMYPQAIVLSIRLRWLALLGGALWLLLPPARLGPSAWILLGVALYNVILWRRDRRDRHPPLLLTAALDLAALTALLALAPQPTGLALLAFLFLVIVLTLAYEAWGALLSLVASAAGIAAVWALSRPLDAALPLGEVAAAFVVLAVLAIALAFVVRRHEEVHGRLTRVTIHDRVTGLYNRRHFTDALDQLHRLSVRGGWPYAILVLDVDGLARVNETRGRPAGDRLLRLIGREIRAAVRGTDVVARVGDDEFAVALPEADLASGERVAEKVRRRISGLGEGLTVTIGVAEAPSAKMEDAEAALAAAQRALAAAKAEGGARIGTEGGKLPTPEGSAS